MYQATLYSCDIESLYTSIPTNLGLKAISHWLNVKRDLIPDRISSEFVLKALDFVLNNNYFIFLNSMYYRKSGTAIGTKWAPPYACLTIGYLEECILFPIELVKYFNEEECELIEEIFKRCMDDGFIIWPTELSFEKFMICLNNLNKNIKFTYEEASYDNCEEIYSLNFLDVTVILHTNSNTIETDIYYKITNSHGYLPFNSDRPEHIKKNIPFNLAKKIITFVSNDEKVEYRLNELKEWLLNCGYPINTINKSFHNAKLQGPRPRTNTKR